MTAKNLETTWIVKCDQAPRYLAEVIDQDKPHGYTRWEDSLSSALRFSSRDEALTAMRFVKRIADLEVIPGLRIARVAKRQSAQERELSALKRENAALRQANAELCDGMQTAGRLLEKAGKELAGLEMGRRVPLGAR